MAGRMLFGLQPLRNVVEIDGASGRWKATGSPCIFRLVSCLPNLPKGWTRFTFRVEPAAALTKPAFHVNCGEGYRPMVTLLLGSSTKGRWTVACYVPPDADAMSMSATVAVDSLALELLNVSETSRWSVGSALALSYGLRGLRRPRRIAQASQALRAAWAGGGLGGLRGAIASTILRSGGPPGPAQAWASDERYARWLLEGEDDFQPPPPAGATRFSVLIPAGAEKAEQVDASLEALLNQVGVAWECLIGFWPGADGPAALSGPRGGAVDARIARLPLPAAERGKILSVLAKAATGDFLVVLDPGDRLAPGALAMFASAPDFGVLHGDEDQIDADGNRFAPFFKPEWSPELLHAFNYFGRPTALRRDLVEQAGGFAETLGAGAEWDLHLRLATDAAKIKRVPRILCHRHHGADGDRPLPGNDAAQHRAAIAAHWRRQGIVAMVSTQPDGTQRSVWQIEKPPTVSIVIVKRSACMRSSESVSRLFEGTRYPDLQFIIVDRNPSGTRNLTPQLGPNGRGRVEFICAPEQLGCYAARNAGARAARGELLLFVDSNVEAVDPDWLAELVQFAARPGVGVVGTMSMDPAGVPWQAGVTIGMNMLGPLFRGAPATDWGPIGSPMLPRTVSAVAGVCQMVRREVFERVGGFDEGYVSANGDVALCLAARAAGWRVAYTPFARLVQGHDEKNGRSALPEDVTRIANDIRRFGHRQDPFFHPALDAGSPVPRLRLGAEIDNAASLGQSLEAALADAPRPVLLDLDNDTDVAAAVGVPVEALLWPPPVPGAVDDQRSAAQWCLDLLRHRPDLRGRFPDALSAGTAGAFGQWLAVGGARRFALSLDAVGHVCAALDAGIAARARQAVLTEAGLRGETAVALLPPGRAALFDFLLRRGATSFRLEEIWWLALECAEDPIRELALSHRFNPCWQALFPDGLTVFGQERFADWLRAAHRWDPAQARPLPWSAASTPAEHVHLGWHANGSWQRRHPDPFTSPERARALLDWLAQPEAGLPDGARNWLATQPVDPLARAAAAPGVNVMGHFCYPSGLLTSVRSVLQGLRAAGHECSVRDVPVDAEHDIPNHAAFGGFEQYDTTLIHVQPEPYFGRAFERAGLLARTPQTYRIGYWYWELETVPESWGEAVAGIDEAWAATRFVSDALAARFDVPVFNLMPGIELPRFSKRPLSQFGVPEDQFTFLFIFSMMSVMERKNPLGLIRAFRAAFSQSEPVTLVLKASFGDKHPVLIKQLHAAASEAGGRIIVIDEMYTDDETISLIDACDSYISLHRSEGLGLTMAEAMLLAKPVIATGYSGNLDFMNPANSLLVDYRAVEIDQVIPAYELGSVWAEPSEAHAAWLMRQVWENPGFAADLGARGRADVQATLSVAAAGQRMADRISAIRLQREPRGYTVGPGAQGFG